MLAFLANPDRFRRLTGPALPVAGLLAAGLILAGAVWALGFSPADRVQGEAVKIMYVHVPAAWMAMAAYAFIAVASLVGYVWRHSLADIAAREAALPGFVFTLLALVTGSIWGRITWGVWWDWDARMTSMLALLFIYAGYMALWRAIENEGQAARAAALLAMVGAINLPIIKFSVDFWETLHQKASVIRADGPSMPASMLWPLAIMALGYTALFAFYVMLRMHTVILEKRRDARARPARAASTATISHPAPAGPDPSSPGQGEHA
ncbi:heme ABC transporter permease CcmC [Aquisalinus flavus]|nr:cytochrome c biogenesis protein CcsA [Aquisalinus flavus]UNE49314.1 heme transporter HemC [Aquisalinus flavus]